MTVHQKKNTNKGIKLLIAFVVLSVVGTVLTAWLTRETTTVELPSYTSMLYINDYSHVFSEQTEQFIATQARRLEDRTGVQIAVAAVPTTYEKSLERYSLDLARKWGVGKNDQDTGVLLLLTTEEAHARIEVGYGMEGCLNDAKCGRILDSCCVEPMHSAQWNRAVMQTWVEIAKTVYEEYDAAIPQELTVPLDIVEDGTGHTSADANMPQPVTTIDDTPLWKRLFSSFRLFWALALPACIIIAVIFFGMKNNGSGGGGYSGRSGHWRGGGFGGGGFGGGGASR